MSTPPPLASTNCVYAPLAASTGSSCTFALGKGSRKSKKPSFQCPSSIATLPASHCEESGPARTSFEPVERIPSDEKPSSTFVLKVKVLDLPLAPPSSSKNCLQAF